MKLFSTLTILAAMLVSIASSCKKDPIQTTSVARKIQYQLFTNKDFSDGTDIITFSLFMRGNNKILLDSPLAPMRIKDIPDSAHKIVFEKTVPGSDTATLTVGFLYSIENVGNSWYLDTCSSGETFKVVNYSFQ